MQSEKYLNTKFNKKALKDKSVSAFLAIFNPDGQLVITHRYDGEWDLIGGSAEENETLAQACIRETKEETGYTLNEDDIKIVDIEVTDSRITALFTYTMKEPFVPKLTEHQNYKWINTLKEWEKPRHRKSRGIFKNNAENLGF